MVIEFNNLQVNVSTLQHVKHLDHPVLVFLRKTYETILVL